MAKSKQDLEHEIELLKEWNQNLTDRINKHDSRLTKLESNNDT